MDVAWKEWGKKSAVPPFGWKSSATSGFLVHFSQGIRLLCPLGRAKLFSAVDLGGQVKVGSKQVTFPIS